MKLVHTVKLSHEAYGSKSWTVELSPSDIGLAEPTSVSEAHAIWKQLSVRAVEMVEGNMVKEGIMTEEEYGAVRSSFGPNSSLGS